MAQPSIPKGTRDFSPAEMMKRNYIFDTIRSVYKTYGFLPIETPAMETMQTLMGKYGEEGDRLIFKILNSGDFKSGVEASEYAENSSLALANKFCEKALRYDLTVPFARFVVMHRNELQLPFKRYQIQPVWRADRPHPSQTSLRTSSPPSWNLWRGKGTTKGRTTSWRSSRRPSTRPRRLTSQTG